MENYLRHCHSCGTLMEGGDSLSPYCSCCMDESGNLYPFGKILKMHVDYCIISFGMSEEQATDASMKLLGSQPAWKNRIS